ncbi:RNA-dependent RNA polymerase [Mycena indigotica]|uniref:RNA-dependent RNA polymerase n=1 Tax=Mycena indigotica TaxID=2126181 RepID=A0A8H6S0E6_9AGAR|nr:RNA-dependent RNA polymerase [Mycena indigotica]KAF7290167.1 RNA-dependent RNA polymerase [Mycena indigotica]
MEFNFNEYLNDLAGPVLPPKRERTEKKEPIFKIMPFAFSMGSMQRNVFFEHYRNDSLERSFLTLGTSYQDEQACPLAFADYRDYEEDDDPWPTLHGTCAIDDVEFVHLEKSIDGRFLEGRLIFTLRRPPQLDVDTRRHPSRPEGIRRATELDWSPDGAQELYSGAPSTMPRGWHVRAPMKFGLWLTYSFSFGCRREDYDRVVNALSRLRTLRRPGMEEIAVISADIHPVSRKIKIESAKPGRANMMVGEQRDFPDLEDMMNRANRKCSFEVQYLILGLVSHGLILPIEVGDLLHYLLVLQHPAAALRSLFRLPRRALAGTDAIKQQVRNVSRASPLRIPKDRVAMRRAVITPTRVLLFPEVIEMGNRVVRAWPKQMEEGRFIRVGFADEDGRLRVNKKILDGDYNDPEGGILARIRNVLRNGVYIAGRHFVFLAAGESQLKDHSCWMVCEDGDFTANRIRALMGDFSKEKVVAKYAARMGLCLSATCPVDELEEDDIDLIEDVQHGK